MEILVEVQSLKVVGSKALYIIKFDTLCIDLIRFHCFFSFHYDLTRGFKLVTLVLSIQELMTEGMITYL